MPVSHESFSELRPFSESLKLAFLSSRLTRSLSGFPVVTDRDRGHFAEGADFFGKALRGAEAVRTLRVTSTAAEEARTYGWAISAFSYLEYLNNVKEKKDLPTVFKGFKSALEALQKPGLAERGEKRLTESVETLKQFFRCLREIARESNAEPVDRFLIKG